MNILKLEEVLKLMVLKLIINMEKEKVNAIMDDITKDSSLCVIREALEQYGNKELTTNLKDDSSLDLSGVYHLRIDKFRNGNLNLTTIGTHEKIVIEFQNNDAI